MCLSYFRFSIQIKSFPVRSRHEFAELDPIIILRSTDTFLKKFTITKLKIIIIIMNFFPPFLSQVFYSYNLYLFLFVSFCFSELDLRRLLQKSLLAIFAIIKNLHFLCHYQFIPSKQPLVSKIFGNTMPKILLFYPIYSTLSDGCFGSFTLQSIS